MSKFHIYKISDCFLEVFVAAKQTGVLTVIYELLDPGLTHLWHILKIGKEFNLLLACSLIIDQSLVMLIHTYTGFTAQLSNSVTTKYHLTTEFKKYC